MDTIKCLNKTDHTQSTSDQCSGVYYPQQSVCVSLLIMMVIKVLIALLSTTTMTANDLIKLNVPRRHIVQGIIFGLSFLLNLYLFANMEEGKAIDSIWYISAGAILLALASLVLEFSHMIFHRARRTSLAPPHQRSLTCASSGEISLAPTDTLSRSPTENA